MQYFNIQMASQLSGVATATIRAWEKRYQAVTPHRAENRHRLYSEEDIEKLSLLARLTDFGQNIGKIARLDLEELKNVYTTLLKKPYRQEDLLNSSKEKLNYHKSLSNLSLAMTTQKMGVIAHELKKIRIALSAREVAINIIPSLYKMIESKLMNQEMTSGHQQLLYQTINHYFSTYLADYEFPNEEHAPLIIASPPNHVMRPYLLGAALLFTHHQKNFLFLGHAPAQSLGQMANQFHAEAIILEVNQYHIGADFNLDQYLDEANRIQQRPLKVFILGPEHLKQSIRRKNCIFIQSLQELDQILEDNAL